MDEPFSALDAQTRLRLQEELLALWQPTSMSVIFVTHDVDEAILLSDRVLCWRHRAPAFNWKFRFLWNSRGTPIT